MSIVLPIVFVSVLLGLWAKRMTVWHWSALVFWVMLVIAYNFVKPH